MTYYYILNNCERALLDFQKAITTSLAAKMDIQLIQLYSKP